MNSSKAKNLTFDENYLHGELEDGRIISTPLRWYPELLKLSHEERQNFRFICRGTGIEWENIDYQLSIASMLIGQKAIHAKAA